LSQLSLLVAAWQLLTGLFVEYTGIKTAGLSKWN